MLQLRELPERLLEYIGLELDSKKVFEILLFGRARGFPFFIIHAELPTQVGSFFEMNWRKLCSSSCVTTSFSVARGRHLKS
jgi:hypothetical protein